MESHPFILTPGVWLGEGTIRFTESPEELHFTTRWNVSSPQEGVISALQEIEVEGVPDPMCNAFYFSAIQNEEFDVRLDNSVLGIIDGNGVIDKKLVSWEFRGTPDAGFEGFEIYEAKDPNTYNMHAEYASTDQLRTLINGRLWHTPGQPDA